MTRVVILNPYRAQTYGGPNVLSDRLMDSLERGGWSAHEVGKPPRSLNALGQLRWTVNASVSLLVQRKAFEVVHIHGAYLFNLVPALCARLLGKRYVLLPIAENGDLKPDAQSNRVPGVQRLRRVVVSRAAGALALSEGIVSELVDAGLSRDRILPMANVVEDEHFAAFQDLRGQWDGAIRLLFLGKLGRRKRPELLLSILAESRARGIRMRATFVGPFESGDYAKSFMGLVDALDLSQEVDIRGFATSDAVASVLREGFHFFALLSSNEGMPGALAESMAAGVVPIVTDVGSMGSVVRDAGVGIVVSSGAVAAAEVVSRVEEIMPEWATYSQAAHDYALRNFTGEHSFRTYQCVVGVGI